MIYVLNRFRKVVADNCPNGYEPIVCTGGLFNALSTSLFGNEGSALLLRSLACIYAIAESEKLADYVREILNVCGYHGSLYF